MEFESISDKDNTTSLPMEYDEGDSPRPSDYERFVPEVGDKPEKPPEVVEDGQKGELLKVFNRMVG